MLSSPSSGQGRMLPSGGGVCDAAAQRRIACERQRLACDCSCKMAVLPQCGNALCRCAPQGPGTRAAIARRGRQAVLHRHRCHLRV